MSKNIEQGFATYALLTDQMVMSGPEAFINDSATYRDSTFMTAWGLKKDLQATAIIKDFIELDKTKRGQLVAQNHKWDLKGRDGMTEYTMGWAKYGNYVTYDDDEIEMNEADKRAQYKRLYKQKIVQMHTESVEELEAYMWADPAAKMERLSTGADIRLPYSIPALITPAAVSAAFTTAGIATKFGINTTDKPNWRNQSFSFVNFKQDVESALFRMKHLTNFKAYSGPNQASFTGTPKDRCVIYTDLTSLEQLRSIIIDRNDSFSGLGSRDGQLNYDGAPIVWAEPLGGAGLAPQAQRMFFVNFDFLYPICRAGWFLKLKLAPYGGAWKPHDMPDSNVIYEYTCWNWWVRSLRRLACIHHKDYASVLTTW